MIQMFEGIVEFFSLMGFGLFFGLLTGISIAFLDSPAGKILSGIFASLDGILVFLESLGILNLGTVSGFGWGLFFGAIIGILIGLFLLRRKFKEDTSGKKSRKKQDFDPSCDNDEICDEKG